MSLSSIQDVQFRTLKAFGSDAEGRLVVLEEKDVGFAVKRIYYIYDVPPGEIRGRHASRGGNQVFICLKGACRFVCDDGRDKREFVLDKPELALSVPPMIWGEQTYLEPGSIALVYRDTGYDPADYVNDYDEFLRLTGS